MAKALKAASGESAHTGASLKCIYTNGEQTHGEQTGACYRAVTSLGSQRYSGIARKTGVLPWMDRGTGSLRKTG